MKPSSASAHPTLQLLGRCKTLRTLKQVHAQMLVTGLALHTYPLSRLLSVSSTFSTPAHTLSIFNQIPNPTIFLFNTVISCFASDRNRTHLAFSLYGRALSNVTPNSFTFPSLFKACTRFRPWVRHGLALHTHVLKFLEPPYDQFVQASLLNYYANCGKHDVSRRLFDRISQPDLASWNSILAAYARRDVEYGDEADISMEALNLFREMQRNSSVRPNEVTLVAVISACCNLGALGQGAWVHRLVLKSGLKLNRYVGTALIEMYSESGRVDLARQVFDQLPQRDSLCYNAMIGGFAIHGNELEALSLYERMEIEGPAPDEVTFTVAMSACSHSGLVERGSKIFESIKEVHGFEPTVEHYGCVVDLLIRAGRVSEAEEKVRNMPMKPNAVIWRSLLVGARMDGELQLGEMALKQLLQLEPEKSENYVLLSNMYASTHRWEDVKRVRKAMKVEGIIKFPGSSLVDIGGAMHEFITGDRTHPHSNDVYDKVEEMSTRLQEHGHNQITRELLF